MLRLYIIGVCILIIAIIANVIVGYLGISTWYNFGPQFFAKGFSFTLSLGYILGDKLYSLL